MTLLRFFLDGALRFHAAPCARVAYVHEICEVHVFPLKVSRQTKQWPERRQRDVKWVSAKEAAEAVQEPKLSAIIRHLARRSAE